MRRAGEEIQPRGRRQRHVAAAVVARVGERSGAGPVLRGRERVEDLRRDRAGPCVGEQPVVCERRQVDRPQHREHRVAGHARHRKAMVEAAAARPGRRDHQRIECRPAALVAVEAVANELAQEASALRVAVADRSAGAPTAFRAAWRRPRRSADTTRSRESPPGRGRPPAIPSPDRPPRRCRRRRPCSDGPSTRQPRTARSSRGSSRGVASMLARNVSVASGWRGIRRAVGQPERDRAPAAGFDVGFTHQPLDRRDRDLKREPLDRRDVELPAEERDRESLLEQEAVSEIPRFG